MSVAMNFNGKSSALLRKVEKKRIRNTHKTSQTNTAANSTSLHVILMPGMSKTISSEV